MLNDSISTFELIHTNNEKLRLRGEIFATHRSTSNASVVLMGFVVAQFNLLPLVESHDQLLEEQRIKVILYLILVHFQKEISFFFESSLFFV